MITVDHRFALSNPALVSAPSKKSFSSVSSPILACKLFKSTLEAAASLFVLAKHPGRAFEELRFPLGDLIGVDVEVLRQLGERLLPLQSGQGHLRLKARSVVPARSDAGIESPFLDEGLCGPMSSGLLQRRYRVVLGE